MELKWSNFSPKCNIFLNILYICFPWFSIQLTTFFIDLRSFWPLIFTKPYIQLLQFFIAGWTWLLKIWWSIPPTTSRYLWHKCFLGIWSHGLWPQMSKMYQFAKYENTICLYLLNILFKCQQDIKVALNTCTATVSIFWYRSFKP